MPKNGVWNHSPTHGLPLAEGVETGQDFRIVIVLQTDAAHQELLVYLTHHRAGAAALPLSHRERHSNDDTESSPTEREKERERTFHFKCSCRTASRFGI